MIDRSDSVAVVESAEFSMQALNYQNGQSLVDEVAYQF